MTILLGEELVEERKMGSMDGMPKNIINFAAGPAKLPEEVR